MTKFLQSIAEAYNQNYNDLSDLCFVFPSKRSGSFFIKYLKEAIKTKAAISRKVMTISDFIANLSGKEIDNRIDLLFILYKEYNKLLQENDKDQEEISFDKFRGWGDIILSDFNEVDMSCVNPDALFQNLRDFKEIQSDYLTEEQKTVINEYLGEEKFYEHTESFWKHFNSKSENTSTSKSRFIRLWEALSPLYHRFNEELERRNLTYTGGAYRQALEQIKCNGTDALPYKKVIFVGFNVLSSIEYLIFSELQKLKCEVDGESYADFYWDNTGPALNDPNNSAVRFIDKNIAKFKSQFDISSSDRTTFPEVMQSISCPSNSTQAKKVGEILGEICPPLPEKDDKDYAKNIAEIDKANTNVAVVLPDEELLLPLLYSFPKNITKANLTMGYSIKLTSTSSFVTLVRKAFDHARQKDGETSFYYKDIKSILAHPFASIILGIDSIEKIRKQALEQNLFNISTSQLDEYSDSKSKEIFQNLIKDASAEDTFEYLDTLLEKIQHLLLKNESNELIHNNIEIDALESYRDALTRVYDAISEHRIEMRRNTFLTLVDRLIASEKISFEGEPLLGVQIMGILETRCLDFDNIIIPSMNERIFPRRIRSHSFIPNTLRKGYGMPTTQFQESIFAYYFYRMISRAKKVYMLYDARTGGMRSGDPSRYITQLQYLYKDANLKSLSLKFDISKTANEDLYADKTEEVMKKLKEYTIADSNKNLSASSLKNYLQCPLKFYLNNVEGISTEDDEPKEFMSAAMIGDVVHGVMQHIYTPDTLDANGKIVRGSGKEIEGSGKQITKEFIDNILNDEAWLKHIVSQHIYCEQNGIKLDNYNKISNPNLAGDGEIFTDAIVHYIKAILDIDRGIAPFYYKGSEVKENFQWKINDELKVNVKYIIDRMDSVGGKIRFVDYKTGSDNVELNRDKILTDTDQRAIFQLFLYANLYAEHHKKLDLAIKPSIYKTNDIVKGEDTTTIKINGEKSEKNTVENYLDVVNADGSNFNKKFLEDIKEKIAEIFNPEIPFRQTDNKGDDKNCKYCNFKSICGIKDSDW